MSHANSDIPVSQVQLIAECYGDIQQALALSSHISLAHVFHATMQKQVSNV